MKKKIVFKLAKTKLEVTYFKLLNESTVKCVTVYQSDKKQKKIILYKKEKRKGKKKE